MQSVRFSTISLCVVTEQNTMKIETRSHPLVALADWEIILK